MVGAIADKDFNSIIEFTVSEEELLTFSEFVRSCNSKYKEHDIQGKKTLLEFTGSSADDITFNISLKAHTGVYPRLEMNKVIDLIRAGKLVAIMIGNSTMGMYRWVITSLSNAIKHVDNMGNIYQIDMSITIKEYL